MIAAGAVVLAAVGLALPVRAAAAGCSVDYEVSSSWQGGFGADVTITILGDPINGSA